MEVVWTPKFKKRFTAKDASKKAAVAECIARVEEELERRSSARSSGLRIKLIAPGIWYARVDRSNRLTFTRDGNTLTLLNHCHKETVLAGHG